MGVRNYHLASKRFVACCFITKHVVPALLSCSLSLNERFVARSALPKIITVLKFSPCYGSNDDKIMSSLFLT